MATFKDRFALTQDLILVFSACAFPIFAWSILNILYEVPAWVKQRNTWDLIGIIAYTQAFALIETILVFSVLLLLGAILPTRLFRDNFVALSSMVVFLSSFYVILAHYNGYIIYAGHRKELAFWLAVYLASIGLFYELIRRYKKVEELVRSFVERLLILSFGYIAVGLLSVIIVILRNT